MACRGTKGDGTRCTFKAKAGDYCGHHADQDRAADANLCRGTKGDGTRCTFKAKAGDYCGHHADQDRAAGSSAADSSRPGSSTSSGALGPWFERNYGAGCLASACRSTPTAFFCKDHTVRGRVSAERAVLLRSQQGRDAYDLRPLRETDGEVDHVHEVQFFHHAVAEALRTKTLSTALVGRINKGLRVVVVNHPDNLCATTHAHNMSKEGVVEKWCRQYKNGGIREVSSIGSLANDKQRVIWSTVAKKMEQVPVAAMTSDAHTDFVTDNSKFERLSEIVSEMLSAMKLGK